MNARVTVKTDVSPQYERTIGVPAPVIREIMEDRDKAVSFARAVLAEYRATDLPGVLLRTLPDGRHFVIDMSDEADASIKGIMEDFMLHGDYEAHTVARVREAVKPGDRCLDVGASVGFFTTLLGTLVGSGGKVTAIEATANQFPYLVKNIELNGLQDTVKAICIAASDHDGEVTIQCNAVNPKTVPCMKLDSLNLAPLDFIKLDVDGSDLRGLQGLEETIKASPNLKGTLEFYPKYLKNLGSDPDEFMAFVNKYFTWERISGDYNDECQNLWCIRK